MTPYIPYSLPINSFHNLKDLLRKRVLKAVQLKLAETMESYSFPSSYSAKLIKVVKRTKGLKRLSLDHSRLKKTGMTEPSMISFMKKARRIQELNLNDSWNPLGLFETKLSVWMKYIKDLPKLTFKLEILKKEIRSKNSFSRHMKCFLNTLRRRQNRMKSLKIQLPQEVSFVNPILLQSKKYPQSLQNLQLLFPKTEYEGLDPKLPVFDLSIFKKLEAFALQITDDHFVISRLMDSLQSLPQLKSLAVLLPGSFVLPEASPLYGPYYYNLDSQVFSNLTYLSVKIPHECMKVTLFERLNLSNLQSLQISFCRMDAQKYQEILSNLSKMKRLKTLKLSITYENQLEHLTKILFENLVDLEQLTSLKISLVHFTIISSYRPTGNLSTDALPALDRIFKKSIKIREFSLKCKNLIISHKFSRLIEIFGGSALNFKKFKLDTFSFKLDDNQTQSLIGFIESLDNVRALKLPCFDIDSNQILTRLACSMIKLKEIRSICLGKIGEANLEEQPFHESLRSLLEKRGMQSFKCEFTNDFNIRLGVVGSPLSFEKISKKNPFLKFVSDNLWPMMNK